MIRAWRLDRARRPQTDSFSGEGAKITGGRWNRPGARCVYTSESLALAALERFVHTEREDQKSLLVSYRIEIPSSVETARLQPKDLPKNWRHRFAPKEVAELGMEWINSGKAAVLYVPSVIVPAEYNLLLNPTHLHFPRIRILSREPFTFDRRMWK